MKVVLGCMEFGRRLNETDSSVIIDEFLNFEQELDTASIYSSGISETILGNNKENIINKNGKISTKICPDNLNFIPERFVNEFTKCLDRLRVDSIDILYLHWPSKSEPIEPLLDCLHNLHEKGLFQRFGLSNFSSWQVAKIVSLCENNGFLLPTVYQGMYNCLTRDIERELFPCIREFGLSFYAYNLLAGGILSGRYRFNDNNHFDDSTFCRFHNVGGNWSKIYQDRFWHKNYFDSIDIINSVLTENRNIHQTSFDWLLHHSQLSDKFGDAILLGASTIDQFHKNLSAIRSSKPLNAPVLETIEKCNKLIAGCCPSYFR